jgi:tRNA G18 (ribose-2'-O)-methylase SpoU
VLIAVAHNLHSLHNVGAIFRTADGAGFQHVILSGHSGDPLDPRSAKVALGAERALSFERSDSVAHLLTLLNDVYVVVLEQHPASIGPADVETLAIQGDVALVACDELAGAPPELLERADAILELPMRGLKESLNVSVAFGIAAYALADAIDPFAQNDLRSRQAHRGVREGVLTRGRTVGQEKSTVTPEM